MNGVVVRGGRRVGEALLRRSGLREGLEAVGVAAGAGATTAPDRWEAAVAAATTAAPRRPSQQARWVQQGQPWIAQPLHHNSAEVLAEGLALRLRTGDDAERGQAAVCLIKALPREQRELLSQALSKVTKAEDAAPLLDDPRAWRSLQASLGGLYELSFEETGTPLQVARGPHSAVPPSVSPPGRMALLVLAVAHGIPFVGFGFLDNFIMITAGESIEASIGATFAMSSMCAAGLGNLISDIAGLSLQDVIAKHSHRFLSEPELTPAQEELAVTQRARLLGSVLGISVGCIVGMCPLLFMNAH